MSEKLELEISLEIKQALINAKAMGDELRALVMETKRVAPSATELKEIMSRVGMSMQNVVLTAQALGDKTGGLAERHNMLAQQIRNLINSGLTPESAEVKTLSKEYAALSGELDKSRVETDDLAGAVQKLTEGAIILGGAKALAGFVAGAAEEFAQAEASTMRLEKAMQLRGIEGGAARFEEYANQLMNLTGASDDLVQQLAAELAYEGKSEAQIRAIIDASADMAAVTNTDLRTAVETLSGSLSGQARELARNIPAIKDLSEEQLKAGAAIDIVARQYAGSAKEMQNSSLVAFARMTESVGNLAESIGGTLAPILVTGANLVTTLAQAGTAAVDVFNSMPAPVKLLAGGIVALTIAATAYTAVQKSALIAKGLENAATIIAIIRTGAHTAAQWLQYAAQMAINAAMAVTNPLLWAGIAAAAAATIGAIALANANRGAAEATEELGKANQSLSERLSEVTGKLRALGQEAAAKLQPIKAYTEAIAELSKAVGAAAALERAGIFTGREALSASLDAQKKLLEAAQKRAAQLKDPSIMKAEVDRFRADMVATEAKLAAFDRVAKKMADEKKALEDAKKALDDYRSSWDKQFSRDVAADRTAAAKGDGRISADDFAAVDAEFAARKAEAIQVGLWNSTDAADQVRVEQMLDRWLAARAKITADEQRGIEEAAQKLREEQAKYTATRLDDIQVAMDRELKAAALVFKDGAEKDAVLATIRQRYQDELTKARIEEQFAAAEAAAKLTATRIDDLMVERDKRLATLQAAGASEIQIASARLDAELQIARTRMQELKAQWDAEKQAIKEKFDFEKELARQNGDLGSYAALSMEGVVGGTELGQTLGLGGNLSVDPVTQLIDAFAQMLTQIENLNKTLNWASTIMEGTLSVIQGPMNEALQPVVDGLTQIGVIAGKVLLPVIETAGILIGLVMDVLEPVFNIIEAILPLIATAGQLMFMLNPSFILLTTTLNWVAKGLSWFYDKVIVPVGNAFIDIINAVIEGINSLAWLTGVTVDKMDKLLTSDEKQSYTEMMESKKARINELLDDVTEYYQEQRDALKTLTSESIASWQDLLEVGAISETDYAAKVAGLNDGLASGLESIDAAETAMADSLGDILTRLEDGLNVDITNIEALVAALSGDAVAASESAATATETVTTTDIPAATTVNTGTAWWQGLGAEDRAAFESTLQAAIAAGNTAQVQGMRQMRGYAVGTARVDGDQVAVVHDDEMIIPKTFADGVRAGEIGIVGPSTTPAGNVTHNYYYATVVEGSVIRERDTGAYLDDVKTRGRRSGRLTGASR